ncbi:MAG: DUF2752 domain-containing protein [Balneolaceae bacterium]|nr:DUF2752 domain-containing protein [Balneolaceae bacterium]
MRFFNRHLEWSVFTAGLLLLALMDPTIQGTSFCFFDFIGINFCPGEGLGHSIAYTFRGEFRSAFQANFMGPFAILILGFRIIHIWKELLLNNTHKTLQEINHG